MTAPRARGFLSVTAGAVFGLAGWIAFTALRDHLPTPVRLAVAIVLVFGPGAGLTCRLLAPLALLSRVVLALSFGIALAPVGASGLAAFGVLPAYPYVSSVLAGGVIAYWGTYPRAQSADRRRLRLAPVVLVLLTMGVGAIAFVNRMSTSRTATVVYGEYDSYDLTYYAEIAAELTHTVPPASPFFSGRMLNHSYYPHLLLALVHRFADVPILDLYFRYAWPAFFTLSALVCFVFVESIATTRAAFLSAVLFAVGSNLSYAAGWFFKLSNWDDVIWSHNFQGAGAEVLLYNNWTPALVATFAGLYAVHASTRHSRLGWPVVAGATFAATILAKPWVFGTVMAALAMVTVVSWRDRFVRTRLLLVAGVSLVASAPFLYRAATLFDDAQVTFAPAFFPIPLVMVARIGLRDWFLNASAALGATGAVQAGLAGLLAFPIFILGGLGFRLVGVGVLWRCLRRPAQHDPIWRILAWTVVAALLIPSFVVSVPYHETTQIHQFALFLLAVFTGKSLASWQNARARVSASLVVIAIAVPSTMYYLHRKWNDQEHPLATMSPGDVTIASFLRNTDPEGTVLLHDRPNDPTLLGILSERRSVISWAGYVRGSQSRRNDVDVFFTSANTSATRATEILRLYRPTHVVEHLGRDRINPEVRDQLELVLSTRDVVLYRVPPRLLLTAR